MGGRAGLHTDPKDDGRSAIVSGAFISSEETIDTIIFPDLRIIQKKKGYRFALDPLLLYDFIDRPLSPAIDLGCGSGVLALLLARRWPGLMVTGLEVQPRLAGMASRSVAGNGLADRVFILQGDIRDCGSLFRPRSFQTVVSNPPYRKAGSGRLPPHPERAAARHEILMTLDDLLIAADHLLADNGSFHLTWKPERRGDLEKAAAGTGLTLRAFRPVISRRGQEPFLMLGRLDRSPGTPPHCLEPLVVYEDGQYGPEAAKILKGFVSSSIPSGGES
jgi:tRNA1Val (adenine37-N6)-methyltransferase